MKLSVGVKIACMNAVAIVVLILLSLANYYSFNRMIEAANWRQHSYEVLGRLDSLQASLVDAETGQRGYLLAKQDRFLEPYNAALTAIPEKMKSLRSLTLDNETQQANLDQLDLLIANKLSNIQDSLKITDINQEAEMLDKGKKSMDDIRGVIDQMKNQEDSLLQTRIKLSDEAINSIFHTIVLGTISAAIFLIIFGLALTRSISKPLQAMTTTAKLLSTSVSDIFASISELVAAGNETAAAVNETTTTIEEVKQTSIVASQKAKSVSEGAQKVSQISQVGKKSIAETNKDMTRIQEQMSLIADSMIRLSEQTQAISSIIETVDDLAQQSNLLAVNASIEAERAGEQGRGFGVVAHEIKNLADQSKQATHRVREILSDVQKATNTAVLATEAGSKVVDAGVKKSEETGDSILKLTNSVSDAAQAALQIAASSQQQLVGVEQATIAMENIKQASTQNVDISTRLEMAANNLRNMGIKLEDLIEKHKIY